MSRRAHTATERLDFVDAPAHAAALVQYRAIGRPFSGSLILEVPAVTTVADRGVDAVDHHHPVRPSGRRPPDSDVVPAVRPCGTGGS